MEVEAGAEGAALEEAREPVAVVLPHLVKRDGMEGSPYGCGLVSFRGMALPCGGQEDGAMEAEAIGKVKEELAFEAGVEGADVEFFEGFADGAGGGGFAWLDAAAWCVEFACAEAAFFFDEEDAVVIADEAECGPLSGLPVFPVGYHRFAGI